MLGRLLSVSRVSVLITMATINLPSTAAGSGPVPLTMTLTVTSSTTNGTVPAAKPISISWKITNPSNSVQAGTLLFYLNNNLIGNAPQPVNATTVTASRPLSGTQTVYPMPGINVISATYMHYGAGATSTPTHSIPITVQVGKSATPAPVTPPPNLLPLAEGVLQVNASPQITISNNAATRQQLMRDYAPLLLYSYDHNSDEKYAPINVRSFIDGTDLVSQATGVNGIPNSSLTGSETNILNPPSSSNAPQLGAITASQQALPAALYLQPTAASSVVNGSPWSAVMNAQGNNVGLYGHVSFLDLGHFESDADPSLIGTLRNRYGCFLQRGSCSGQVIKMEYWQFFGYSYDLYTPTNVPGLSQWLADAGKKYIDHVGDWCSVQLYVDAAWWQAGSDKAILAVYHYVHGRQIGFDMGKVIRTPTQITVPVRGKGLPSGPTYAAEQFEGPSSPKSVDYPVSYDGFTYPSSPGVATEVANAQNNRVQFAAVPYTPGYQHPVVYVEWGGHEFWPVPEWSYTGASKHNGGGSYSYFGSAPLDLSLDPSSPSYPDVQLVTTFAGFWGTHNSAGPPPGPPLHLEWYWDPATTSADLLNTIESRLQPDSKPVTTRVY